MLVFFTLLSLAPPIAATKTVKLRPVFLDTVHHHVKSVKYAPETRTGISVVHKYTTESQVKVTSVSYRRGELQIHMLHEPVKLGLCMFSVHVTLRHHNGRDHFVIIPFQVDVWENLYLSDERFTKERVEFLVRNPFPAKLLLKRILFATNSKPSQHIDISPFLLGNHPLSIAASSTRKLESLLDHRAEKQSAKGSLLIFTNGATLRLKFSGHLPLDSWTNASDFTPNILAGMGLNTHLFFTTFPDTSGLEQELYSKLSLRTECDSPHHLKHLHNNQIAAFISTYPRQRHECYVYYVWKSRLLTHVRDTTMRSSLSVNTDVIVDVQQIDHSFTYDGDGGFIVHPVEVDRCDRTSIPNCLMGIYAALKMNRDKSVPVGDVSGKLKLITRVNMVVENHILNYESRHVAEYRRVVELTLPFLCTFIAQDSLDYEMILPGFYTYLMRDFEKFQNGLSSEAVLALNFGNHIHHSYTVLDVRVVNSDILSPSVNVTTERSMNLKGFSFDLPYNELVLVKTSKLVTSQMSLETIRKQNVFPGTVTPNFEFGNFFQTSNMHIMEREIAHILSFEIDLILEIKSSKQEFSVFLATRKLVSTALILNLPALKKQEATSRKLLISNEKLRERVVFMNPYHPNRNLIVPTEQRKPIRITCFVGEDCTFDARYFLGVQFPLQKDHDPRNSDVAEAMVYMKISARKMAGEDRLHFVPNVAEHAISVVELRRFTPWTMGTNMSIGVLKFTPSIPEGRNLDIDFEFTDTGACVNSIKEEKLLSITLHNSMPAQVNISVSGRIQSNIYKDEVDVVSDFESTTLFIFDVAMRPFLNMKEVDFGLVEVGETKNVLLLASNPMDVPVLLKLKKQCVRGKAATEAAEVFSFGDLQENVKYIVPAHSTNVVITNISFTPRESKLSNMLPVIVTNLTGVEYLPIYGRGGTGKLAFYVRDLNVAHIPFNFDFETLGFGAPTYQKSLLPVSDEFNRTFSIKADFSVVNEGNFGLSVDSMQLIGFDADSLENVELRVRGPEFLPYRLEPGEALAISVEVKNLDFRSFLWLSTTPLPLHFETSLGKSSVDIRLDIPPSLYLFISGLEPPSITSSALKLVAVTAALVYSALAAFHAVSVLIQIRSLLYTELLIPMRSLVRFMKRRASTAQKFKKKHRSKKKKMSCRDVYRSRSVSLDRSTSQRETDEICKEPIVDREVTNETCEELQIQNQDVEVFSSDSEIESPEEDHREIDTPSGSEGSDSEGSDSEGSDSEESLESVLAPAFDSLIKPLLDSLTQPRLCESEHIVDPYIGLELTPTPGNNTSRTVGPINRPKEFPLSNEPSRNIANNLLSFETHRFGLFHPPQTDSPEEQLSDMTIQDYDRWSSHIRNSFFSSLEAGREEKSVRDNVHREFSS